MKIVSQSRRGRLAPALLLALPGPLVPALPMALLGPLVPALPLALQDPGIPPGLTCPGDPLARDSNYNNKIYYNNLSFSLLLANYISTSFYAQDYSLSLLPQHRHRLYFPDFY